MTQFLRYDQAEHLVSMSIDMNTELLRGLSVLIDKIEDKAVLSYIQLLISDARYAIEALEMTAEKLEVYQVNA